MATRGRVKALKTLSPSHGAACTVGASHSLCTACPVSLILSAIDVRVLVCDSLVSPLWFTVSYGIPGGCLRLETCRDGARVPS